MKRWLFCLFALWACLGAMAEKKPQWALLGVKGTGEFHDGLAMFRNYDKDTYGFINTSGVIAIEAQFKRAEDFQNGQAIVEAETGKGIINRSGYYLLEPQYDKIERAKEALNLYVITDTAGNKGVFFNSRLVLPPSDTKSDFSTSNFPFINDVNILTGKGYDDVFKIRNIFKAELKTERGRETVYCDNTGNEMIDTPRKSSKGIIVFVEEQNGKKKYGFKNAFTGAIIQNPTYYAVQSDIWIDDYIIGFDENGSVLINAEGKIQMRANLLMYEKNSDYFIDVDLLSEDVTYTLYSKELKKIISAQMLYPIIGNWYRCESKDETFAINVKTKQKYPGKYFTYGDGVIRVSTENDDYYYFDATTGKRTKGNYKYAYDFSEGLAVVEKEGDNMKIIIDKQGKVILRESGDFKITGNRFSEGVLAAQYEYEDGYVYNPLGNGSYVYNQTGGTDWTIRKWFEEGTKLLNKKHYAEAKEMFYRVMMNDPKNDDAINNYGVCLDHMGYQEEALEAFTMAYEIDPSNNVAKNNIELMKQALSEQEYQEADNSKSATFWDALSSFANAVAQMTGQLAEYQTENSYVTMQNMGGDASPSSVRQERINARKAKTGALEKESNYRKTTYKTDERTYIRCEDQLRDMDLYRVEHYGHMSESEYLRKVKEVQRKMKSVREKMIQNGVNRSKSSYEDWIPRK